MAVKILKLSCPGCGANLEIDGDLEVCYCKYCGAKLKLVDDNKHTHEYTITRRDIDEARIEEAKRDTAKEKYEMITMLVMLFIGVALLLLLLLFL